MCKTMRYGQSYYMFILGYIKLIWTEWKKYIFMVFLWCILHSNIRSVCYIDQRLKIILISGEQKYCASTFYLFFMQVIGSDYFCLLSGWSCFNLNWEAVQWNLFWETTAMKDHLSWRTTYSWQKVPNFSVIESVTKDHLSNWETIFLWPMGWSFKIGSTVYGLASFLQLHWYTFVARIKLQVSVNLNLA